MHVNHTLLFLAHPNPFWLPQVLDLAFASDGVPRAHHEFIAPLRGVGMNQTVSRLLWVYQWVAIWVTQENIGGLDLGLTKKSHFFEAIWAWLELGHFIPKTPQKGVPLWSINTSKRETESKPQINFFLAQIRRVSV